ncbi:hypothetical protein LTR36_004926 [Oleoguttula mirabilis]|uniref:non-specific serine/threonine protein kinase n=1 Tax=Oleoguttula mirabilis TaxID=1507867 RepID=A0AAV9JYA6_9PEZI|nr:hypothetical protein LTR36_004926 [Oleoguttula mirabilis]
MGGPPGSQAAPLPSNLPFRLVSKTIGSGAYASIRKAAPLNQPTPIIAVKFINKEHAFRAGRLRPKQLQIEVSLHQSVCPHQNIIRFLSHGQDASWVWMCLELADGGDLFDKIEADEGCTEDVAHLYFTQLTNAIGWCHSKGVAHRDIKPENMLLSKDGDLKLADFGLATQFVMPRTGERKKCGMVCGSPPYIAPEILEVGTNNMKRKQGEEKVGYDPQVADVWSCAIVLFVLFAGNTPWDSPVLAESYEYHDYVQSNGRPQDELWTKVPPAASSLVRGMLKVSAPERFTLHDVRKHPWYTRRNPELSEHGLVANPVNLATQMLESLRIDFSTDVSALQRRTKTIHTDHMEVDSKRLDPAWTRFASTQPETPVTDAPFDWEAPPRLGAGVSASQPMTNHDRVHADTVRADILDLLSEDPSMSQFSHVPVSQMTATQQARHFKDIVPSHSLARFLSHLAFPQLLPMLISALHRLNIPVAAPSAAALQGQEEAVSFRIKTVDANQQLLQGNIVVERIAVPGQAQMEVLEVRFLKAKGDPLGWRRLFKQVAVLCKDAIPRQ